MGGRIARQPYGALDKSPQIDHETYFKVKSACTILLAFVVSPEDVAITSSTFCQVVIVTSTGVDVYNLKTAKVVSSIRREILTATMGVQENKKILAYVEPDNTVFISNPTTLEVFKKMDFSERVTALKFVPEKYLAVGLESGAISWADLGTLTVAQIETQAQQPVSIFTAVRSGDQSIVIAGFRSDQRSKLFLFTHVEGAIQAHQTYESLPGTCADIAIVESEKMVLSLCEGTGALYVWDLENCNYLLSINLSPTPLNRLLVFESSVPEGPMTLVLGGSSGVVVGMLSILESTIKWTPKCKSQIAGKTKVQPGAVSSLEYEKLMDLLIYGDHSGQVWLIPGVLGNVPRPSLSPKGVVTSSEAPLSN